MSKNINLITLGNLGVNLANEIAKTTNTNKFNIICLDTNKDKLNEIKKENITKILIGKGQGAGGDPKIAEELVKDHKAEIQESINNSELNLICYGAGGGTGEGLVNPVLEYSKELGVVTVPIALTESIEYESLNKIKEKDTPYINFNQDVVYESLEKYKKDFTREQWMCLPFRGFERTAQSILNIATKVGDIAIDIADIKNAFKFKGKAVAISEEGETINEVDNKIEASPFFEKNFKQMAKKLLLLIEYPENSLTQEEFEKLENKFQNNEKSKVAGVVTQSKKFRLNVIMTGLSEPIKDVEYITPESYKEDYKSQVRRAAQSYNKN